MRRALPPLNALRAFEAAARHLSFKAAAEELGVTPTAISHQIRELEATCGQSLFRRRPRPLALTEPGARLFPVLRGGFDSFATAVSAMRGEVPDRRLLRVTTTNAFAHRWLVPRLPLWRRAHPGVALEVIGTDTVVDLPAGEADLAIRYARAVPSGLVTQELFRDRFWPICSPALLASGRPVRSPADLLQHTLVHMAWQPGEPLAPTWRRWLEMARGIDPTLPRTAGADELTFREELHAIEAVIAGQGIAICSDLLVARELETGALVKALDLPLPGFGFYLVHVPGHPRRDLIGEFSAWARSLA